MGRLTGFSRYGLAFLALLAMAPARADIVDVTVSISGLDSVPSVLAFDFISASAPPLRNQVTLSTLTTDGTVQSTSKTGDVTGTGPWVFGNSSFFNELLMTLDLTGTALAFSIETTDVPADAGATPDSFSFFILDTDGITPLVLTDDPLGAHALFQFELGRGADGLHTYLPAQDAEFEFTIKAARTPSTPVPEPSTVWLLAWLGAAVAVKRHSNRVAGRA